MLSGRVTHANYRTKEHLKDESKRIAEDILNEQQRTGQAHFAMHYALGTLLENSFTLHAARSGF